VTLVVDANIAVAACLAGDEGFVALGGHALIAPDLMWWEAASTLHEYVWLSGRTPHGSGGVSRDDAVGAFDRLLRAPVEAVAVSDSLQREAWRVADRCGFAKVYDAVYVALAGLRGVPLVTLDAALTRSPAARLVTIIGPTDIQPVGTEARPDAAPDGYA
jgi:predicted nucleic acid-binding protein